MKENNLVRIRVSKLRHSTKHQVLIAYINQNDITEEDENIISGYYYTCQSGARTLGTCAHIVSVLWYLDYARHQLYVKYPQSNLLYTTMDAAHRADPEDP